MVVAGATVGGVAGHFLGREIPMDDLRKVAEALPADSSALLLLLEDKEAEKAIKAVEGLHADIVVIDLGSELSGVVAEAIMADVSIDPTSPEPASAERPRRPDAYALDGSVEVAPLANHVRWTHGRNQRSKPIQPAFRQANMSSEPRMISSGFEPSTPASTKFEFMNTPPNAAMPVSNPTSRPSPTASSPSATSVANRPAFGWTMFSRNQA